MYDPLETEISFDYLKKIVEDNPNVSMIGGWAVFFYVNNNYRKAFGIDYLKSRDIDVFVPKRYESDFSKSIRKFSFEKSGYPFRYELVYDRENKKIITEEESKKIPLFNLIEIFLDVFSDAKTREIGSWELDTLKKAKTEKVQNISLVDAKTLMQMKCISFFEREKLGKEFNDACDIYALLVYSGKKFENTQIFREALKKISNRDDLCDFVAEHVLRDSLKAGLVRTILAEHLAKV